MKHEITSVFTILTIRLIFILQDYVSNSFKVIYETQDCGSGGTVTCTHSITVLVNNTEVQMLPGTDITVNGVGVDRPFENQFVSIRRGTSKFTILEIFGMRVKWDGEERLYVTLSPVYLNKVSERQRHVLFLQSLHTLGYSR